jgi:hypothetical protein
MTIDILQNFLVFLNNQKRNVEDLETFFEKSYGSLAELRSVNRTLTKLCRDMIEQQVQAQGKTQEAFQKKTDL